MFLYSRRCRVGPCKALTSLRHNVRSPFNRSSHQLHYYCFELQATPSVKRRYKKKNPVSLRHGAAAIRGDLLLFNRSSHQLHYCSFKPELTPGVKRMYATKNPASFDTGQLPSEEICSSHAKGSHGIRNRQAL